MQADGRPQLDPVIQCVSCASSFAPLDLISISSPETRLAIVATTSSDGSVSTPNAPRSIVRSSSTFRCSLRSSLGTGSTRKNPSSVALPFHDYLLDHVRARHAQPREDLLSGLVHAEVEGQRLNDEEIVGFATILLIAGHVTTTSALANALLCLDEDRDAQDALRADPTLIPTAVEEVLRFRSPVTRVERVAARDVSLGGQRIGRGEEVHLWLPSANRDERAFPNPDGFVMDRHPNRHLAFATGIHFCLGAPLARLELLCALEILLQRFSHIRVDPDRPPVAYPTPVFNGVEQLFVQVQRA
jgi:cytochrome P450